MWLIHCGPFFFFFPFSLPCQVIVAAVVFVVWRRRRSREEGASYRRLGETLEDDADPELAADSDVEMEAGQGQVDGALRFSPAAAADGDAPEMASAQAADFDEDDEMLDLEGESDI